MLGVAANGLVMADEIVFDVTRLTDFVLRSPVIVHLLVSVECLLQDVLNKLLEFHVVSAIQRPGTHDIQRSAFIE